MSRFITSLRWEPRQRLRRGDLVDSKHAGFGKEQKEGERFDVWMCSVDYAASETCEEISICCLVHSSDWRERRRLNPANMKPQKHSSAAHLAESAGKYLNFFFCFFFNVCVTDVQSGDRSSWEGWKTRGAILKRLRSKTRGLMFRRTQNSLRNTVKGLLED